MENDQKNESVEHITKKCSSCGEVKAGTEFSKDRTKKDGLYHLCKGCRSAYRLKRKDVKKTVQKRGAGGKTDEQDNRDVGVLAIVHSGVKCGICSVCGQSLMGYIPGYLQGHPVCKDCIIINLKTTYNART